MKCILCGKKGTINLQQGPLCGDCFTRYFQKKVYSTIRKYSLFTRNDKLCVACSGGKDSLAILYLINKIAKRQHQPVFALGVDEGVPGYREKQLADMQHFCEKHGIDYVIVSFKEGYGHTIEELMEIARKKKLDISQCTMCGILRRKMLNAEARKFGATKMVVGHNLDDEAETAMMNMFKGSIELMGRLGPVTGAIKHKSFIPRIKPLYFCSNEETALFTKMMGIKVIYRPCPHRKESFRDYVDRSITRIDNDYPGTKTTIIQNMLKLIPLIRKGFSSGKIQECSQCGEPSKGGICKSCDMLNKLGIKSF